MDVEYRFTYTYTTNGIVLTADDNNHTSLIDTAFLESLRGREEELTKEEIARIAVMGGMIEMMVPYLYSVVNTSKALLAANKRVTLEFAVDELNLIKNIEA